MPTSTQRQTLLPYFQDTLLSLSLCSIRQPREQNQCTGLWFGLVLFLDLFSLKAGGTRADGRPG